MKKATFFLLLYCFTFLTVRSQAHKIEVLGLKEGLSNSYITSITQDRDGFLWFATESGLNRFDGSGFTAYEKDRELYGKTINCNELNKIYADQDEDIIWIATQREGLNEYNYRTKTFNYYKYDYSNIYSIVTNDITDVTNSKDGNLWVATYHGGVDHFNKKTKGFTHYNTSTLPQLVSNQVWAVKEDNYKNLYIGHVSHGLSILSLKDNRVKNFLPDPSDPKSIPGNSVRAIYIDKAENIWIGTSNGLALFDPESETFTTFRNSPNDVSSLVSNYVYTITQMNDGKIYIGTQNGGISILDTKNKIFLSPENIKFDNLRSGNSEISLSNSSVTAIYQDTFDNIWIGTYGGDINFISNLKPMFSSWQYNPIPSAGGLSNPVAWGICTDTEDNLWIGTDGGGINYYEHGVNKRIITKERNGINDNAILSAMKDSQGNLWFGTYRDGAILYNHKNKQFKEALSSLKGLDVRHFYEDRNNNIWISTHQGVFCYNINSKQIKHFHTGNSPLQDNLIRSIIQDKQGNFWIGSFGQGIVVADQDLNMIARMRTEDGLYSNTVNHIFCDNNGCVWVATGEGLVLFDSPGNYSKFKIYTTKDGLSNNHIRAITNDNDGNIWVSTNNGINKLTPSTSQIQSYSHYNGVPLGAFMNASVTKTSDGKIYFGSQNGLCFFDPKVTSRTIDLAPIAINDFIIYDTQVESHEEQKSVSTNREINLTHTQNTFQVSFNTLDYAQKNMVEYAYILEGLDNKWITLQEKNTITFRDIPPGNYILQIKARIKNQNWDTEMVPLPINIAPPVWLTWWAKLLYFLIIVGIILALAAFYKRKLDLENSLLLETEKHAQEQSLNDERLRFYTNITHELRTPLTLITGPLDDLKKDRSLAPKQMALVSTIHKSAVRLLSLINQILEFRKTETQNKRLRIERRNIAELVNETAQKYIDLNLNPDLHIRVGIETEDTEIYFDADVITTIIDNLISNAIKHTSKGEVIISIKNIEDKRVFYTEIEVRDTGTGISQEALSHIFDRYYREENNSNISGTGIGLALVHSLVQLHQGAIAVKSKKGGGSSFYFRIQTDNTYPDEMHISHEEQNIQDVIDIEIDQSETKNQTKPIVLVVEDNDDIRSYIKDSLCDYYEIVTAQNGAKGLELAQNFTPDIIISDIMMPIMDGIEMCKQIKEDIRTSHIPVILLTAKDSVDDRTEGYNIGADSYIVKPFNSSLLHSRITNLLEARHKAAQAATNETVTKGMQMMDSISKLDSEFLEKINSTIESNLDSDKLDVAFIADKLNMSHSTFYRKVKALTGNTANEYIRKRRMMSAEQLLLSGKYTISEVSFMVGINSLTYFRQCFKDEYGLPPSEYIKHIAESVNKNPL